jgi:hypothetical protein
VFMRMTQVFIVRLPLELLFSSLVAALPIYLNVLSNAILRNSINSSVSISVSNHPFPLDAQQQSMQDVIEAGLISVFITLAVNYVPAALSSYIIIEKMTKSKHSQYLSGAGVLSYCRLSLSWHDLNIP